MWPGLEKLDAGPYGIGGMDTFPAERSLAVQHLLLGEPASGVGEFMRLAIRRFDLDPARVAVYAPAGAAPRAVATRGALWCALHGAIRVPAMLLATPSDCARVVPFRVKCAAGGGALPHLEVCFVAQPAGESEAPIQQLVRQRRLPGDIADALREHRADALVTSVSLQRYLGHLRFDAWQVCPCAYLWFVLSGQGAGLLTESPSCWARCEEFVRAIARLCYPRASEAVRASMVSSALGELGAFFEEIAEEVVGQPDSPDPYPAIRDGLCRTLPLSAAMPGSSRLVRVSRSMGGMWVRIEAKFEEVWMSVNSAVQCRKPPGSHIVDRAVLGDYADVAICPRFLSRVRKYTVDHKYRPDASPCVVFGRGSRGGDFSHFEAAEVAR